MSANCLADMLTRQFGQHIMTTCQPDICQHVANMQTCLGDMSFVGSWWQDMTLTFTTKVVPNQAPDVVMFILISDQAGMTQVQGWLYSRTYTTNNHICNEFVHTFTALDWQRVETVSGYSQCFGELKPFLSTNQSIHGWSIYFSKWLTVYEDYWTVLSQNFWSSRDNQNTSCANNYNSPPSIP